ncbi:MAG: response regulator transcription factor [Chloroflexi bacterium]|nr:response regulator transcription factor [Chloroflexota bacterium]
MISVLLVDDQAIVRQGLRSLLSLEPDIVVVGEAADGEQALRLVAQLQPEIVLLDVRMPHMDGLTALRRIKNLAPRVSVIMVTLYDDPNYLLEAVASGAAGYILKDASREELVRAVRVVADGGAIIDPTMMPGLLRQIAQILPVHGVPLLPHEELAERLTEREIEVLRLIAKGYTNQQIAEVLVLSPTTVKTHVQNILQKMNVSDRTQAAVQAVRGGLI